VRRAAGCGAGHHRALPQRHHRRPPGKLIEAARAAWTNDEKIFGAFGLQGGDYDDSYEVWPENWPSWALFVEVSGQWRVGFNGRYALDYTPLFMRMERLRLPDADWELMFSDVRLIERTVLEVTNENKPQ
jgi:hypothetical protein